MPVQRSTGSEHFVTNLQVTAAQGHGNVLPNVADGIRPYGAELGVESFPKNNPVD
jgi:hypothetical protein